MTIAYIVLGASLKIDATFSTKHFQTEFKHIYIYTCVSALYNQVVFIIDVGVLNTYKPIIR